MIAAAGEPNIRQYMPTVALPVIANSVVVETVPQSSALHDPPVILFIGEILERKGIVILLDALDQLDAQGVGNYELRILGDNRPGLDPLRDQMVNEITARGRGATMTGPVSRSEVYRHLSEADLYVFPTFTEGQPFTVIEALAAGVPIVASNIQAISNMIEDGVNGRMISVDDTAGFTQAISELLADPERRSQISQANRALAVQRFDRAVFRERIAVLYRESGRAAQ